MGFLALPVLTVLTLFGGTPFWHHRLKQYQHGNAAYGRSPFRYGASLYDFYRTYLGAAGLFVVVVFLVAVTAVLTLAAAMGWSGPGAGQMPAWPPMVIGAVYLAGIVGIQSFVTARIQNTVWNRTRIDRHTFTCDIKTFRLFGIQFTNLLATVLTLSLFRPFGQVRLARYLTSVFTVEVSGGMDDVEAGESDVTTAAGDEAAEFFDIDIAL